jgi:hypothetical protein
MNTTSFLSQLILSCPQLMVYLPDGVKIKDLPKSFLFTLLATTDSSLYNDLKKKTEAMEKLRNRKLEGAKVSVFKNYLSHIDRLTDTDVSKNNLLIRRLVLK